jgi:translation initiation factor 3 subunit I
MINRLILLKGHERPITKIKFGGDGILYSCSKDTIPSAWHVLTGTRIGTFEGHRGAVLDLDVSPDSKYLVTGGTDCTCKIWDISTGALVHDIEFKSIVCSVSWLDNNRILIVQDNKFRAQPTIYEYEVTEDLVDKLNEYFLKEDKTKITRALWNPSNNHILGYLADGRMVVWDYGQADKIVKMAQIHDKTIRDCRVSFDMRYIMTASEDKTVKLWSHVDYALEKTFNSTSLLNSACMSPDGKYLLVGGGEESVRVALSSSNVNQFDAQFYDPDTNNKLGGIKGHFGPINTTAFSETGKFFATGSEDGFIRLYYSINTPPGFPINIQPVNDSIKFGSYKDVNLHTTIHSINAQYTYPFIGYSVGQQKNTVNKTTPSTQKYLPKIKPETIMNAQKEDKEEKKQNSEDTLYVSNLSQYSTQEDVHQLFQCIGKVKKTFKKENKTFAFVTYYNREDGDKAIEKLHKYGFNSMIIDVARKTVS